MTEDEPPRGGDVGLEWMLEVLPGTSVAERVRRIYETYAEFANALVAFVDTGVAACPEGCGTCCELTDPEVTRAEAEFLAVYLVYTGRPPLGLAEPFRGGCIFYDAHSPLHCTVYEARPFLCRSFAFSSSRDKNGGGSFHFCKEMPTTLPRLLDERGIELFLPAPPPSMTDFGSRIAAGSGEERLQLSRALPSALSRVWLLKRLQEGDHDPDDTNPTDRPDGDGNDRPPEAGPSGGKRAA